jgi:hypothetical protein
VVTAAATQDNFTTTTPYININPGLGRDFLFGGDNENIKPCHFDRAVVGTCAERGEILCDKQYRSMAQKISHLPLVAQPFATQVRNDTVLLLGTFTPPPRQSQSASAA